MSNITTAFIYLIIIKLLKKKYLLFFMKKVVLFFSLFFCVNIFAGELIFNISGNKTATEFKNCYWVDKMANHADWIGITIISTEVNNDLNKQLIIYLPSYNGAGKYQLEGTRDFAIGKVKNAAYYQGQTFSVAPEELEKSYVNITKDANGMISGVFHIVVYSEGKMERGQKLILDGKFTDVAKLK